MKNSGVAWIGKIPNAWQVFPLKDTLRFMSRGAQPTYANDTDFFITNQACLSTYQMRPEKKKECDPLSGVRGRYKQGDVLVASTGEGVLGKCVLSEETGYCDSHVSILRPKSLETGKIIFYWLSVNYETVNSLFAKGSTKQTELQKESFLAHKIAFPPLPEQLAIADYLDRQTALIDQRLSTLAEKKAVLAELRKATIHEAETKGSAWNAETGLVEGLPNRWTMLRIKDVANLRSGDFIAAERIELTGDFPVYGGNGLRGYTDRFTHNGAFALIGRQGALCGNVNYATGKFWATEHAVIVRHKRKIVTQWLGEMLRCMNLNQYATASAQPGLSVEVIINKFLPFPPLDEQQTIAAHLDQQTQQFDTQLATLDEQAQVLKELRKAIIHEAVTGKIDLSGTTPPQPKQALAA